MPTGTNTTKYTTNQKKKTQQQTTQTTRKKSRKKSIISAVGGLAVAGGLAYGVYSLSKRHTNNSDKKKSTTDHTQQQGTDETGDGTGTSTGSSSDGKTKKKTVVEEIPIDNYEEAYEFAMLEWNKLKRDNGRVLECQALGSTRWLCGEWCKVYLPSFDIDNYMYIIRTSQSSEGGDWTTNLSLVDYPPGWGKEEIKTEEDGDDDEENSDEEETDEENNTEETTTS